MPATADEALRLECPGCGTVLGLDRDQSLVARLRPFVIEHRACEGTSYDVDSEMRSAFPFSA